MKNLSCKIGIISITIFCLSACSTPLSVDNTKEFEKAEQYYQTIKDYKYDYSHYQIIPDTDKPVSTFIALNRFDSSIDYTTVLSRFSVELPLKTDSSKKYILDFISGVIDVNGFFVSNPFYASEIFVTAFEDFAKNSVFNTTSISGRETQLVKVKTTNATYIIYTDGTVGREYSDGIHYSTEKFSLCNVVLDYLSIKSYMKSSVEALLRTNIGFVASYNGNAIEADSFNKYFEAESNTSTTSYVYNSKVFDLSKMIDITYIENEAEHHLFLSSDGMIIKQLDSIALMGSNDLYGLTSEKCIAYEVTHTKMDAEAVFALFEQ